NQVALVALNRAVCIALHLEDPATPNSLATRRTLNEFKCPILIKRLDLIVSSFQPLLALLLWMLHRLAESPRFTGVLLALERSLDNRLEGVVQSVLPRPILDSLTSKDKVHTSRHST
ncbi:hypothetical protein NEOLEDRAFT_1203049, partial [Neolentinus lepideus HHB14362 ss-1]